MDISHSRTEPVRKTVLRYLNGKGRPDDLINVLSAD
jgi:hypothetical protein